MKCQDVEILISAHIDGEVTASEWRDVERHIENCTACAEQLALFQKNDALIKQELSQYAPGAHLWGEIAVRIDSPKPFSRLETAADWASAWTRRYITKSSEKLRYAQVGFALGALLIFVFFMLRTAPENNVVVEKTPSNPSRRMDAPQLSPLIDNASASGRFFADRLLFAQRLNNYFERAGYLLLEIKNDDSDDEAFEYATLKKRSKRLLEETIVLKHDLKSSEFGLIRDIVEQLEFTLYDIANLDDQFEKEDFELLKAAILKRDLLIKIEVIDLKKLRESIRKEIKNSPAASQNDADVIL